MPTNQQRLKRAELAKVKVLSRVPFFAPAVARLPVEFSERVETAATDGERIIWNPTWFDELADAILPTVLCHEACHCLFGHIWRKPSAADHGVWNQAIDHATNLMLKEFSALVTAKSLADPFPFPEPHDAYCADPQFKGMAEESIYAKLASRRPQAGGGSQSSGQSNKTPQKGNSGANPGGGKPQKGSMPSFGDVLPVAKSSDPAKQKALQSDWDGTLINSAKIAAQYSSIPGDLERLVDALVKPKVRWQDVLRNLLRQTVADDWDWLSPCMEMSDSGFVLPSLKSDRVASVVFATDWSGSTFGELVNQFHAEKQNCLDEMRPSKLTDIAFDTRVIQVKEYSVGDTIDPVIKGGGGTSFVPIWKHLAKESVPAKAVVVLTDLEGDFGTDPGVPVIWCVYGNKGSTAPFGQVIQVE